MVGRLLVAICIAAIFALHVAPARADEPMVLSIPYRSQFDNSFYAGANCGPASMGMILEGLTGKPVSTAEVRALTNKIQGSDAWDGVYIYNLAAVPKQYGLQVEGLYQGNGYHTWTIDDVRQQIRRGRVVVPEVRFRFLPGHEGVNIADDHYIVLFGLSGDGFIYHDPAFYEGEGAYRTITEAQLKTAMGRSEFPNAAFAVVPPPRPPTPTPTPTPTPMTTPTPIHIAPGYGEVGPIGAPPAAMAQLVPGGTPSAHAARQLDGEASQAAGDDPAARSRGSRNSLTLQIGLTLTGLLSLGTIGVAVSRRW